ncbi:sterol desaturase family protein [Pollutibacter soli]|uniref:sterol desaturase family protein n=1 Tax=Pollutibacter soli TaxID=3034157 RepID=UPI003013A9BA
MHLNCLALAVSIFTGLMGLEYYAGLKKNKQHLFSFDEAVANVNIGIAERLSDLFTTGLFFYFFSWLYKNYALFDFSPGWITWLFLFISTDFVWYWYHRFGHRINIFWSVHVVHHQSTDFNYTVSARITVFQAAARCLFWSVQPLLGFPPLMITVMLMIHGTYPFFTHTQLIGKLGWLEYFLVTPSHHRVHHSSNPEYLDRNYGDVLIIWDKLFGTFAEEKSKPVYGLTKPLGSHSFLWQHFHFLLEMLVSLRMSKNVRQKLKIIFGKPEDIDPRIRTSLERKLSRKQRCWQQTNTQQNYIRWQTIISLFLLFLVILFEYYLTPIKLGIAAVFIILSLITTGAMIEQRRWIFFLEYIRFTLIGIFLYLCYPSANMLSFYFGLLTALLLFYKTLGQRYHSYLFLSKSEE